MPRKSDAHKWLYADLPGGEYPRPAQRCARCGLVRIPGILVRWLYLLPGDYGIHAVTEPPCTPKETNDAP